MYIFIVISKILHEEFFSQFIIYLWMIRTRLMALFNDLLWGITARYGSGGQWIGGADKQ